MFCVTAAEQVCPSEGLLSRAFRKRSGPPSVSMSPAIETWIVSAPNWGPVPIYDPRLSGRSQITMTRSIPSARHAFRGRWPIRWATPVKASTGRSPPTPDPQMRTTRPAHLVSRAQMHCGCTRRCSRLAVDKDIQLWQRPFPDKQISPDGAQIRIGLKHSRCQRGEMVEKKCSDNRPADHRPRVRATMRRAGNSRRYRNKKLLATRQLSGHINCERHRPRLPAAINPPVALYFYFRRRKTGTFLSPNSSQQTVQDLREAR